MFSRHGTSLFLAFGLVLNLAIAPLLQAAQSTVVPRDTVLKLVLNNKLSTKDSNVGDKFTARLAEDVVVDGRTLIRHGAVVEGTVTQVERPKRLAGITGKAKLMMRFDRIRTNGTNRPLTATIVSVHDPVAGVKTDDDDDKDAETKVGEEGEVKAKTDTKDILTKGAIGVAAGAVLGALFGNVSRGVVLGSIGGAVAVLAPKGKDVKLDEGTGLQIRLDRDLNVGAT